MFQTMVISWKIA